MRIAICDDEEAQRALIEKYLYEWAETNSLTLETVAFSAMGCFVEMTKWTPTASSLALT